MEGVNIELQRQQGGWSTPEDWYDVSAVSGAQFQQEAGNPVLGAPTGMGESMGSPNLGYEGYYAFAWIPDIDPPNAQNGPMFVVETTEAINPLYVGPYSIGTYTTGNIAPSGAAISQLLNRYAEQPFLYPWSWVEGDFAPGDASSSCNTSGAVSYTHLDVYKRQATHCASGPACGRRVMSRSAWASGF